MDRIDEVDTEEKKTSFLYLNNICSSLVSLSQALSFIPTHGLQHLVTNITTVDTMFSRLFVTSTNIQGL